MFIKHHTGELDESMMQRCIFCGEVISDYRNVMYPKEQGPPKGFAAGDIYVRKGNPKITTTIEPSDEQIIACNA